MTAVETLERIQREAETSLDYIRHGDILEGIAPSDPEDEARWTLRRIERALEEARR